MSKMNLEIASSTSFNTQHIYQMMTMIKLETKGRPMLSILPYGAVGWTLKISNMQNLEALESCGCSDANFLGEQIYKGENPENNEQITKLYDHLKEERKLNSDTPSDKND